MGVVYERDYPKPGEKWKHFKGHVYEILRRRMHGGLCDDARHDL
ncbi:hypothetical protein SAMN02910401_00464 [Megasphaera elsdenii]|nr:hypothetical protein SAMN02910401_00464 [Megasphaera elsdenii]